MHVALPHVHGGLHVGFAAHFHVRLQHATHAARLLQGHGPQGDVAVQHATLLCVHAGGDDEALDAAVLRQLQEEKRDSKSRLTTNADYFVGVERVKEQNYIPKVGEGFEVLDIISGKWNAGVVNAEGVNHFLVDMQLNREESILKKACKFRPIQTKREKVIKGASDIIYNNPAVGSKELAGMLYDAGMLIEGSE